MATFSDRDFPPLPSEQAKKHTESVHQSVKRVSGAFATINDLPPELLLHIIKYLPGIDLEGCHHTTLVNLSQVNRQFHNLVAEKLYIKYTSFFCEPYLFLRTVISNANVANFVREVEISYGTKSHFQGTKYIANAQDKKLVKEGFRAFGIPNWKQWTTACNTDPVELDTLHSAILIHLPKVVSISIRDDWKSCSEPPKWVDLFRKANIGTSPGNTHRFENLQSLQIEAHKMDIVSLAPVFRISSLKKLSFVRLVDISLKYGSEELKHQNLKNLKRLKKLISAGCNTIEEFRFERSFIQHDVFAIIVESSQNLKTLDYDLVMDGLPTWFTDLDEALLVKFATALESQKESLENLILKLEKENDDTWPAYGMQSLHDFASLRFLRYPLDSIVNCKDVLIETLPGRLPRSLEIFHAELGKCTSAKDVDPLAALRYIAAEHPPSLREIHLIIGPQAYEWHYHLRLEEVKKIFSRTDIDFVVKEAEPVGFDSWDQISAWCTSTYGFQSVPDDSVTSESSDQVSLYSEDPGVDM